MHTEIADNSRKGPGDRVRPVTAGQATNGESRRAALTLGALGVVFGDIGTSPIYTVQTVFDPGDPHPVPVSDASVLGVISLIFWSVTIVVTVSYVLLIMRADNDGEGGIMALITLLRRKGIGGRPRTKVALAALGIFGASLFLGDSMITPAISVLSAIEGVEVASPSLGHLVVPITAAIIVALFLLQRVGTATVGRLFGPIMLLWFAVIAACGVRGIAQHPEILEALLPTRAVSYAVGHFSTAFFALAAVVLAVTGAEALYADMGHFGRTPIRLAWLLLVFPACTLSYLGQGALILEDRHNISSPFFLLVPDWGQWPLVFLATAATVIASQAVVTGAFSVAHQAVQLGYLPRLRISHTSAEAVGQVYVPLVNWVLLVSVLTLVIAFQSSAKLAFAYGMAVTGTITIAAVLFFYVARLRWRTPLALLLPVACAILSVDLLFLAANLTKFLHGGWLPLLIAVSLFAIFTTWKRGREIVAQRRAREEGSLRAFLDDLHDHEVPVQRVPGTAVFLNRTKVTVPLAMRTTVEHLHSLSEHVLILSIETQPVPHVPPERRVVVDDLGYRDDAIAHVTARFGYLDQPDVPSLIHGLDRSELECSLDDDDLSYVLSLVELTRGADGDMPGWRKRLFIATSRISTDASVYFCLPPDRTLIVGQRIEI
jgi:KUP system potassium uptake protein